MDFRVNIRVNNLSKMAKISLKMWKMLQYERIGKPRKYKEKPGNPDFSRLPDFMPVVGLEPITSTAKHQYLCTLPKHRVNKRVNTYFDSS